MRNVLFILLSVELLISILSGQGSFLHRHDFDRAWFAWQQNPTPENRMELDKQERLNTLYNWGFAGIEFAGMAVVTLLAGYACQRYLRSASAAKVDAITRLTHQRIGKD